MHWSLHPMWPQLEFYVLHYPSLVGLPGYCALITNAAASWFTFYRGDRRTGFELLICSWLMLCFGVAYGFWSSMMYGVPDSLRSLVRDLLEGLIGPSIPFLLTVPVAVHLLSDDDVRSRKLHRLLLAGAITGLLDTVVLFLYLLSCFD